MLRRWLRAWLLRSSATAASSPPLPLATTPQVPPTLFKYQQPGKQALFNLLRRGIHFSDPRKFNDPYDCDLNVRQRQLDEHELDRLRREYLANAQSIARREELLRMSVVEFERMSTELFDLSMRSLEEHRLPTIGVACFSEVPHNLLMWSHYAAGGSGFCIELATSDPLFGATFSVDYAARRPEFDILQALFEKNDQQMVRLLLVKASDWSYEREWRSFAYQCGDRFVQYEPASLLSVRFGTQAAPKTIRVVSKLARRINPNVKLFRGTLSRKFFSVDFEPLVE